MDYEAKQCSNVTWGKSAMILKCDAENLAIVFPKANVPFGICT